MSQHHHRLHPVNYQQKPNLTPRTQTESEPEHHAILPLVLNLLVLYISVPTQIPPTKTPDRPSLRPHPLLLSSPIVQRPNHRLSLVRQKLQKRGLDSRSMASRTRTRSGTRTGPDSDSDSGAFASPSFRCSGCFCFRKGDSFEIPRPLPRPPCSVVTHTHSKPRVSQPLNPFPYTVQTVSKQCIYLLEIGTAPSRDMSRLTERGLALFTKSIEACVYVRNGAHRYLQNKALLSVTWSGSVHGMGRLAVRNPSICLVDLFTMSALGHYHHDHSLLPLQHHQIHSFPCLGPHNHQDSHPYKSQINHTSPCIPRVPTHACNAPRRRQQQPPPPRGKKNT
ncbi:hypothetical protein QBC39DRAFT_157770 [Podospora conica]|nr:hypothetical protein QBC39DRAFT_157770 [Schizothecium conicum]